MNPSDNNSFGMPNAAGGQGMMAQPVAPRDTGDILLPGSEKKGGKKWIYALLGVVVAVILVAVGAWMITKGNGGESPERVAFNEYANYLLYGTESSEDVAEKHDVDYVYYFDAQDLSFITESDDADAIVGYYGNLLTKLDNFNKKVFDTNNEELKNLVSEYDESAVAYFKLNQKYFLDEEVVRNYFVENGEVNTRSMIDEHYKDFEDSDNTELENMYQFLMDQALYYLTMTGAYGEAGCIADSNIDYECSRRVNFEVEQNILEIDAAIRNIMRRLRNNVVNGCWEIYEKVR